MKQETSSVALVRRDEVPSMRTVVVNGVEHWLGHVKDFTKHETLVNFLPKDNRIAIAWVRLEAGEQLTEHTHPVDSMILMCEGGARTVGEVEEDMHAGDLVIVPQGKHHGFIGAQPNGFWGLSLQFDSRGLYEDIADPWATFTTEKQASLAGKSVSEQLFKKNEEYMERFDKHRLFALVRKGLLNNADSRRRFLDCFQVWSNQFQKMVMARVLTLQEPKFEELAWTHLLEELGHNRDLAQSRSDLQHVFDPVLEATASWFHTIMGSISDAEKVVLVHLVVEASATSFYKYIQPAMAASGTEEHFDRHKMVDDGHTEMGYEFLRNHSLGDGQRLFAIQERGWAMLTVVMGRIADLVVHHAVPSTSGNKPEVKAAENKQLENA